MKASTSCGSDSIDGPSRYITAVAVCESPDLDLRDHLYHAQDIISRCSHVSASVECMHYCDYLAGVPTGYVTGRISLDQKMCIFYVSGRVS